MSDETAPAEADPVSVVPVGEGRQEHGGETDGKERRKRSSMHAVGETILTVVLAIGLAWLVQAYVIKPYRIPSGSMERTLMPGDRVLVARFAYDFGGPSRGDVIVFHPPGVGDTAVRGARTEASVSYIKRVIGMPGDWVTGRDDHVWICRQRLSGCRELQEGYVSGPTRDFAPVHVPQGQYFMMGDNRDQSDDSRDWGTLPRHNIIGEAFATYWPPLRIGLLG